MSARRGDELFFVPLGGAGEIGMNLNLYGFGRPGKETYWLVRDGKDADTTHAMILASSLRIRATRPCEPIELE